MNDVFALSSSVVDSLARFKPTLATFMGVSGFDHLWDDFSPEGHAQFRTFLLQTRDAHNRLRSHRDRTSEDRSSEDVELASDVLEDWVEAELDRIDSGDFLFDLNSLTSSFQVVRMVFDMMQPTDDARWSQVAARMHALPEAMERYQSLLAEGVRQQRVVARRQVEAVLHQCALLTGPSSFFPSLAQQHAESGHANTALQAELQQGSGRAQEAIRQFGTWLEKNYLPFAATRDGVGRERYIRAASRFLGMNIDPQEVLAWGWNEVQRLREEFLTLGQSIGLSGSIESMLHALRNDPSQKVPSVDAFLEFVRGLQQSALDKLDGEHFQVPDSIRKVAVKRAPPSGTLGAYYSGPSEDLRRPGTIWYSLEDGPVTVFDQVSTAYHEGFPGHHLQLGTAVCRTQHLSRLHRLSEGCTGFAEGWALYVERFVDELGMYEQPSYRLGMIANQLLRALRIVIDIGAHLEVPIPLDAPFHPGEAWTYERGVEVLHAHGMHSRAHAESEMKRYLGWPGQAIAYKLGEREMLRARNNWMQSHKGPTALRDFHAAVLETGGVGLARLHNVLSSKTRQQTAVNPQ